MWYGGFRVRAHARILNPRPNEPTKVTAPGEVGGVKQSRMLLTRASQQVPETRASRSADFEKSPPQTTEG